MTVRKGDVVYIGGHRPANRAKVLAVSDSGHLKVSSGGIIGQVGPGDYEEIEQEPQPEKRPAKTHIAKARRKVSTGKGK